MPLRVIPGLVAFSVATVAFAQNPPPPPISPPEEYRVRDAVESSFVNLATFPVRPMAFDAGGNLWAVNQLDSTITRFTGFTTPGTTYPLPWNPAAVAFWPGLSTSSADDEMLVTCRGSWTVVELSVATGDVLQVHQLRPVGNDSARQGQMAEPGDIIVVGNQALVTCGGADTVVQIDLSVNPRTTFIYDRDNPSFTGFDAKAPLFMSKGPSGKVYVAPLISGNNTIAQRSASGSTDVLKPVPPGVGLPDSDLFVIDPVAHTINVVAKKMGTILFAHGINPASNPPAMWMLNTEAFNAEFNSEPEANGRFSQDRISIFVVPTSGTVTGPNTILPLDPGAPTGGISGMTKPLGQPFSLTFLDNSASPYHGYAFLCGLLTDNVLVLDAAGNFVRQWTIAGGGAIPRQVLLDPNGRKLLVYCWGQNSIRVYDWSTGSQTALLTLGFDPTPSSLTAGRAVFFSAQNSRFGNLSCASCHIEGGSDLLAWNLSNVPQDDKGPMVTQTLVGIQRMAPFHWRGERNLPDFRGAFKGLLGRVNATTGLPEDLDVPTFDQLQAYLFSLTNPANPNQSRRRVLDAALATPGLPPLAVANAVTGQNTFNDTKVFAASTTTCASCHSMPLGTFGDIIDEFQGITRPRRTQMKPPPFHELWRKEMGIVSNVSFDGNTFFDAPFLGSGFAHVGFFKTLYDFIDGITLIDQETADITAFVHQFDQGLGQADHYAFLLNSASTSIATAELKTYLLDQARGRAGDIQGAASRRNCDIVVFGTVKNASGVSAKRRWYFDRNALAGAGIFRCDDSTFTTSGQNPGERTIDNFLATASTESNVFLGLPVGMGVRFGVDYDLDGTLNAADAAPTDPAIPGPIGGTVTFQTTNSNAPVQLLWVTTKSARIRFDTNVPTRYEIYVWPTTSTQPPTPQITTDVYSKEHTVLVGDLRPSTNHNAPNGTGGYFSQSITYNVLVNAIPRVGTAATASAGIKTFGHKESTDFHPSSNDQNSERQMRLLLDHVISDMSMSSSTVAFPNSHRTVTITTSYKRGGKYSGSTWVRAPAPNRAIIARVFAQDMTTLAVRPLDNTQLAGVQGSSFLVDEAYIDHVAANTRLVVGAAPVTNLLGTLVASGRLTPANGTTAMEFDLLQPLSVNEKLIFSVEAVVECTNLQYPTGMVGGNPIQLTIPTAFTSAAWTATEAWAQWSFPDTKEAGAQVRDP